MPTQATERRAVTPQNLAKILDSVPPDTPADYLHSLTASGIFADVLSANPEAIERINSSSLRRDLFREMLGLKPKSSEVLFTIGMSAYQAMAHSIKAERKFPKCDFYQALIAAIKDPRGNMGFSIHMFAEYEARQRLTAVSFAPGMSMRAIAETLEEFQCKPADLRSYIKFLAYLWKNDESVIPEEIRDGIFVGGFAENGMTREGISESFIFGRRSPKTSALHPASSVNTWHKRITHTETRIWVLTKTNPYSY